MTTIEDFKTFESLKQELKDALVEKCIEFEQAAKGDDIETYFNDDYQEFLVQSDVIVVFFQHTDGNGRQCYTKHLPIDIVFDSNFKDKMKERFESARVNARKKRDEMEKEDAVRKKRMEIAKLKELMAKYPDVVKEGV